MNCDNSINRKQIVQHLGEAIDIIPSLDLKFDLIFIDADKATRAKLNGQIADVKITKSLLNNLEGILPKK